MRKILTIALFTLFWPLSGLAETVDLTRVLQEAVRNRPFVVAAREEAGAAQASAGEARSRYFPRLALSESLFWTDDPGWSLYISLVQENLVLSQDARPYNFPPSRKDFETRLSLDQPLFDPDIGYGLRRAQKGAEAALAAARWSRQQAAFAAFQAYLQVQRASAARVWTESSRREAEEVLRLAEERQEGGVGLKADTLRARVFLSETRRRSLAAENDLRIARRALALAMGRPGEEVDIAEELTPDTFPGEEVSGPMRRGDLEALSLQAREAELAQRQSRAAYLPRANLTAYASLHDASAPFGTDAGSWTVRADLTWEIFDGLRRSKSEARAASNRRAAESRHLEARRQAMFQAEEAELRAEEAKVNRERAVLAVAEAEESHRLLLQRYETGLSDLSDLRGVQTDFDRARLDAVNAEADFLLALARVQFQRGTFLKTLLPSEEALQ